MDAWSWVLAILASLCFAVGIGGTAYAASQSATTTVTITVPCTDPKANAE